MYRKLFTRLLTLITIGLIVYFAFISTDTGMIRPETSVKSDLSANELSQGEVVGFKSFGKDGRELSSGTIGRVSQTDLGNIHAEDIKSTFITSSGRRIFLVAGFFKEAEDGRRVMYAKQNEEIVVREQNGITIRTIGPLVYDESDILTTDARARFELGGAEGECVGLRYRGADFLELKSKVVFTSKDGESRTDIEADFLKLNDRTHVGTIKDGLITTSKGENKTTLAADNIRLNYVGGTEKEPYRIVDAAFEGAPARFVWARGELEAATFDACFDSKGRWVEELVTGWDAQFTSVTEDEFWLTGQSGQLKLTAYAWEPRELTGSDAVMISGKKGDRPEMFLKGQEGMATSFLDGRATSTRIFGTPVFSYDGMSGRAGSLRVMHGEHQILFSEGGELTDKQRKVHIKGDEILISNWDLREKEVFAFRFVEIIQNEGTPQQVHSFASELKLRLPENRAQLRGDPARLERTDQTVSANVININQVDGDIFDMTCDEGVTLNMITEVGTYWIEARSLDYGGKSRRVAFQDVLRAVTPNQGEFSAGELVMTLKRGHGKPELAEMTANRDVFYKGRILSDDKYQPISCQADVVTYHPEDEEIHFRGINRDIIFIGPRGESRNRGLIYNLKDGSLSGYSERNRTSTTTVPLDRNQTPKNRKP